MSTVREFFFLVRKLWIFSEKYFVRKFCAYSHVSHENRLIVYNHFFQSNSAPAQPLSKKRQIAFYSANMYRSFILSFIAIHGSRHIQESNAANNNNGIPYSGIKNKPHEHQNSRSFIVQRPVIHFALWLDLPLPVQSLNSEQLWKNRKQKIRIQTNNVNPLSERMTMVRQRGRHSDESKKSRCGWSERYLA